MNSLSRVAVLAYIVVCASALFTSNTQAQATITVRVYDSVGRTTDGTVTLRAGQTIYSCRTVTGLCRLSGVALGTYQATLAPVSESAPAPQAFSVSRNTALTLSMRSVPRPTTQQVSSATTTSASVTTTTTTTTTRPTTTATAARPTPAAVTGVRPTLGQTAALAAARPTTAVQTTRPAQICNSGRLLNSRGRPVAGSVTAINGTARRTVNAASNGTFRVCGLPHGRWTITATGGGESTRVTRTVSARTAVNLRTAARSVRPATPARRPVTGRTGVRRIVR